MEPSAALSPSSAPPAEASQSKSSASAAKAAKRRAKQQALLSRSLALLPPDSAWTVRLTRAGRGAVAVRDIPAGTTIQVEKAYGWILKGELSAERCAQCTRVTDKDTVEPECCRGSVQYCSADCRDADAITHEAQCELLQKVDFISKRSGCEADLLRLVISLVAASVQEQRGGAASNLSSATESDSGTDGAQRPVRARWEHVCDLVSHLDKATEEWLDPVAAAMVLLHDELQAAKAMQGAVLPTTAELVTLCARLNSNSHAVFDNEGSNSVVGVGLWPASSVLNHSCFPSVLFSTEGRDGRMRVRTIRPVKEGEELTLPYLDLFQPRLDRQIELFKGKHFVCACERCALEEKGKMPSLSPSAAAAAEDEGAADGDSGISPQRVRAWMQTGSLYCPTCKEAQSEKEAIEWADDEAANGKKGRKKKKKAAETEVIDQTDASSSSSLLPPLLPNIGLLVWRGKGSDAAAAVLSAGETPPAGDWTCTRCGARESLSTVERLLEPLHSMYSQSLRLKRERAFVACLASLKRLLAECEEALPPLHALPLLALTQQMNVSRARRDYALAEESLLRLLQMMRAVFPPSLPELSDFYVALAEVRQEARDHKKESGQPESEEQARTSEAAVKHAYAHAFAVRVVACGEDHPRTMAIPEPYRAMPDPDEPLKQTL